MITIQGAVSNQIVKCIIFTKSIEVGIQKLQEIEEEKINNGIKVIRKVMSSYHNEITFSDGEEWIVVNPNYGARGYRWRKAYVDATNTTIAQLQQVILPTGDLYQWEKEKYFNW